MQFEILAASIEELPAIVPLFDAYRVFYGKGSDPSGAAVFLTERLSQNESRLFWARNGAGKALGFVQLYPSFSSVSMQRLWVLNDLYVSPGARKQGVGEALMERARQLAIETQAKGLMLETGKDNHAAQTLYEKLGYVNNVDYYVYYLSL